MPCLLPTDCLNEIFENLDDDKITLFSCLLVSRLWCKMSVGILWRDILRFEHNKRDSRVRKPIKIKPFFRATPSILSTLVSCLPYKSKDLLHRSGIYISTPTSKQPLFNYAAFCKVFSINEICRLIYIRRNTPKDEIRLVVKEILKMFMNQVPSLKTLNYSFDTRTPYNIPLISFSGARNCLTDLSELQCSTFIDSEFFYGLSQICHNLRSLAIEVESEVSNWLIELVSSQNNLRNFKLSSRHIDCADIVSALMKHTNTLTKLQLRCNSKLSLSFIYSFLNLQEIEFLSSGDRTVNYFRELQYVTFPKLKVLKIDDRSEKTECLRKFLEINGKNLQECHLNHDVSDLSIDKFCPNLKNLFVSSYGLDMMKTIFNSCQDLEGFLINKNEELEIVAKHSPKNFYALQLYRLNLSPEVLESFFISWGNRKSKKSLSLIIINILELKEENMKIIEKYKNLGVVKNFEFIKLLYHYFDKDIVF